MLEIIISLGLVGFLLITLAFKLDDETHPVLKVFALFFTIFIMVLIAKSGYDSRFVCEILGNYTNNVYQYGANFSGYHWDYDYDLNPAQAPDYELLHVREYKEYDLYCFENPYITQTSATGFKVSLWFFSLIGIYLIIFVINLVGNYLKKLNEIKKTK